jgi:hypothetical protein
MVVELLCMILLIALCCAAEAEAPILGMGRRYYFGEGRLDIKYTTELATPHIDWADPYAGGRVSAFVVPSVMEGRTLVELMQRLSMEVDAVTIDPAWDVNKWTMSFGDAYGARSEQDADGSVDYSFVYKYLQEDLEGERQWDVMIMHGILGWGHLPEGVRRAITHRVRQGMGLVIVGPYAGAAPAEEYRQLVPLTLAQGAQEPHALRRGERQARGGAWRAAQSHYITAGVPLETLPGDHLLHRPYRATEGAAVLVASGRDPVVAVKEVGQGRVVAFGYDNYGLAPLVRWESYGEVGDAWWETWYSLLIRSVLWAARKEPTALVESLTLGQKVVSTGRRDPVDVTVRLSGSLPPGARVRWQVRSDGGAVEHQAAADVAGSTAQFQVPVCDLPGDRHLVDVSLVAGDERIDWATTPLTVRPPVRLTAIQARPPAVEKGRRQRISVAFSRALPKDISLTIEVVDNYQRTIAREDDPKLSGDRTNASAGLVTDDLLTHIGWVRATLWQGGRILDRTQTRVALATPPEGRAWDDYEVNLPFYGPHSYYHWMPLLDQQYRRAGMTWLMEPERNFRFSVIARPEGLGVYHYDRKSFDEQRQAYWDTGDRKYLVRKPCLHRDWRQQARRQISRAMKPYLKYRPFHYYIYDEPSLTSYTRSFDFCFSDETLAAFRTWLQSAYGSLAELNKEWGTRYTQWRQVEPPTSEQAQKEGPIPAWADFRRFMDLTFAQAFRYTQEVVDEVDPGALTLVGGTQQPTPFNGTDWWLLSRAFGVLEPYFGIDHFRSFNPDLPLIQACGYGSEGSDLENAIWRRALQGQRGATIFWNYTFHDPDLMLNSQGEAMKRAFGALRGEGVARLLYGSRRDDSRIALLHSQASLYAAWIQDGDIRSGRSDAADRFRNAWQGWQQAIHQLSLHYRWIPYEQLAAGGLSRDDFDVLILPHTLSLSQAELDAIRAFTRAGGLVVGDGQPGSFDEHCKPRRAAPLAGHSGVHLTDAVSEDVDGFAARVRPWLKPLLDKVGVSPPVRAPGASPEVFRYIDGDAQYVGIAEAPAEAHRIELPRSAHVYDIRRRRYLGHTDHVEVPQGNGGVALYALLPRPVNRVTVRVASEAQLGSAVSYEVEADDGAPAFRHVFAVRVYGPDGRLRHMYGTNVEGPSGAACGSFRLAWNDAPGTWRVEAVDAATGVSGEAVVHVR